MEKKVIPLWSERARALRPEAEDWMNLRPTAQMQPLWDMETEFLWIGILWDHLEHFLLCFPPCLLSPAAACQQQMCLVGLRLVANKHSNIDFSMPSCLTNDVLGRHRVFCVFMWKHIEQWITLVSRSWSRHACWPCS